ACFGETMLLLVPDPPVGPNDAERFRREIGGAESNVAINLRRLGAVTSWHSAVGQDAFGGYIVSRIASEGVECVARRDPDRLTGLYVKEVRAESTTRSEERRVGRGWRRRAGGAPGRGNERRKPGGR